MNNTLKAAIAVLAIAGAGTAGYKGTVSSEKPQDTVVQGELTQYRTANSKVWDTGTTVYDSTRKQYVKVYYSRTYINDVHYRDKKDGKFKAHDLRVLPKPFILAALSGRDYEINSGEWKADFEEEKPYNFGYENNDASVTYKALFDTTEAVGISVNAVNQGVKETIILKDDTAPTILQWMVAVDGIARENGIGGYDIFNKKDNFAFRINRLTGKDADNKDVPIETELTDGFLTAVVNTAGAKFPITIDPTTSTQTTVNDGRVLSTDATYITARDRGDYEDVDAGSGDNSLEFGQSLATGDRAVMRLFQHYVLSQDLNISTVSACSLYLYLFIDVSTNNFEMDIIKSNHSGVPATTWANDFYGWAASDPYIVTPYVFGYKNTSTLGAGWNFIPYVQLGLDSLNAVYARADTHRIALLSYEDISNSDPDTTEYVVFYSSSESGKEPYLSFTYTTKSPTGFAANSVADDSITCTWTDNITGEDGWMVMYNDGTYLSTTDLGTGGTASANYYSGAAEPAFAFDDFIIASNNWQVTDTPYPFWLRYDYGGSPKTINRYSILNNITVYNRGPTAWTFKASDDSTSWTTLDSRSGITWADSVWQHFACYNVTAYRYYQWDFTAGTTDSTIRITELNMYEEQTVAADTEELTLINLLPNTKYVLKVQVLGGTADTNTSNADSARTWAAIMPAPSADTLKIGGLYGYIYVIIDTTGTKNPSTTLYAIYIVSGGISGADTVFVAPVTGAYDTLREGSFSDSWPWQTLAQWGGANGDTVIVPTGNILSIKVVGKNTQ